MVLHRPVELARLTGNLGTGTDLFEACQDLGGTPFDRLPINLQLTQQRRERSLSAVSGLLPLYPHFTPDSPCRFSAGTCAMEIKFKLQAVIGLGKEAVHLQKAQQTFKLLGRSALDKLQEARRTSENDLRKLLANSLDVIVVVIDKLVSLGSQVVIALNKKTVHLQRAQQTFKRLGRSAVDKLQEARRTRENELRKLLANSLDAIVVTDSDHRLVCANQKALDLFGVSQMNMRKFTIDTFLSHCQSLDLRRKWFAIRRDERYGKCKISRLDGNLRVAEYIFVPNFISRQDLYRFDHVAAPGITQLKSDAKMPIS
jgi:PAS domain S-box-containing protein